MNSRKVKYVYRILIYLGALILIPFAVFRSGLDLSNFLNEYIDLLKVDFFYDLLIDFVSYFGTPSIYISLLCAYFSYLIVAMILDIAFDLLSIPLCLFDNLLERWF